VFQQFGFVGPADEVKPHHLNGPKRWFAAGPQRDQHTHDDRDINLNLNTILAVREQVAAAQHMLEEAEKQFDRPALAVDQPDRLGWK
jgi:hypothetical protein